MIDGLGRVFRVGMQVHQRTLDNLDHPYTRVGYVDGILEDGSLIVAWTARVYDDGRWICEIGRQGCVHVNEVDPAYRPGGLYTSRLTSPARRNPFGGSRDTAEREP